jgi:hypothetical protein
MIFNRIIDNDNFDVINYHKKGDIGKRGKYTGKPYDSDWILFSLSEKNTFDNISIFLEMFLELGINSNESIDGDLYIAIKHDTQCNFELDKKTLRLIAKSNLSLSFSCYQ